MYCSYEITPSLLRVQWSAVCFQLLYKVENTAVFITISTRLVETLDCTKLQVAPNNYFLFS
jgi:hypothetical protein